MDSAKIPSEVQKDVEKMRRRDHFRITDKSYVIIRDVSAQKNKLLTQ